MINSACLIFNPVAGQSNPEQDIEQIKFLLESAIDLDIIYTTPEVDAPQLAKEAIARGVEAIIVSGGDGTVSAVAEAAIGSGIPLGIIARGTANAFANALGIPTQIDAACETILAGSTKVVDAALCNDKPMVLLAGIGFEAETVENADREAKNRLGILAYILAGVGQLRNLEQFDVEIETEDRIIKTSAVAVTVANTAPPTSILAQGPAGLIYDDGLLDLTIVASANLMAAIAASYDLLNTARSGEPTQRDDIGYMRARKVKITTDPPQKVALDGEIIGTTPINVECLPGALTIFMPNGEEEQPTEKLEGLPNLEIETK
jgi:YegS/Rv2252/BmrU family lipid kinase